MNIESILNVECSRAITKYGQPGVCNLLEELLSNKYHQLQNELRAEIDPDMQKHLKNQMPVLLPSGIFKDGKEAKNLIKHTGLIAIDVDEQDNRHIVNFSNLKNEFCKIPNVAYCGLSIRGKGYWLLIPIKYPNKHKLHFQLIEKYFADKGIIIDQSCINVNRLRFYSYDEGAYFNHAAKPLQAYYRPAAIEKKQSHQRRGDVQKSTGNLYQDAKNYAQRLGYDFVGGKKHMYLFHFCSFLNSNGVKQKDAEDFIERNLMPLAEIKSNCITSAYK